MAKKTNDVVPTIGLDRHCHKRNLLRGRTAGRKHSFGILEEKENPIER
jgi:hypothetical protein